MTDKKQIAAAKKLGLQVEGSEISLSKDSIWFSLGGWLGIAESLVPGTSFAVTYAITKDLLLGIVISGMLSLAFIARQIIAKRPLAQAISGVVGLALTAYLALRPGGNEADYFLPGLITNLSYAVALAISVLIRWPLIGLLVGIVRGDGFEWRKNSAQLKRYSQVTLLWVLMFSTRLLVEVPLYLSKSLEALAVAKLILGLPWYALFIWFSWLSLKSVFANKG
ncbi:MAG: DUF3159 domain-containing protein [Micrococcales bacterium]